MRACEKDEVYQFIVAYIAENDYPPSVRDIVAGTGLHSTSSVAYRLKKLESQGCIQTTKGRHRTIIITKGGDA